MELSERKKKILASVVERYIMTGEPVGSKLLCGSLSVSSATVRNEMSELSEIGFLEQPHTSAGRIPSQKGIRYYISNLMTRYTLSDVDRFSLDSKFDNTVGEPKEVLTEAVRLLSDMTGCASIASTPYDVNAVIKRVELVPISSHTALIILLVSTGVIKSRICRCDNEINLETAELFYNIAGAQFIGHGADELTIPRIQTLAVSLGEKALVMSPLLVSLAELAKDASESDVLTDGQSKLLGFKDIESDVYNILEFLKNSDAVQKILSNGREKLNISIGRENMNSALEQTSIICSRYSVAGKEVGSMGIIGPVRMDYARIIPNLMYVGDIVGKVLSEAIDE